jgi:transcriptional regulator with XRE-family HTH domain
MQGILNCTTEGTEPDIASMHVARNIEQLLEPHRHPDGHRWTGAELEKPTGGIVSRSYMTNLRKGRIESPGNEKMRAIAKAMGFAPELWFEEDLGSEGGLRAREGNGIADRLEHLCAVVKNPKTGELYTNAEVARMSAASLTEKDVKGIELEDAILPWTR